MKAGRELDRLVHINVMGRELCECPENFKSPRRFGPGGHCLKCGKRPFLPHYSANAECAWRVVERLASLDWRFNLTGPGRFNGELGGGPVGTAWTCMFRLPDPPQGEAERWFDWQERISRLHLFVRAEGGSAAEAICLAAVAAVGSPPVSASGD